MDGVVVAITYPVAPVCDSTMLERANGDRNARINPPRLVSNIRFVQKFYPTDKMDGYAAYCLTNLVCSNFATQVRHIFLTLHIDSPPYIPIWKV